jgi:NAD(P)-dependent dehydrogenase (short-subunit alcohol dehydrogenase family)
MIESERLDGRVALITGAASGIGLATAGSLLDAGARVHAAGSHAELAERRLGAERLGSGRLTVHQLDVTDRAAVEELVERIGQEALIDTLVCCAGTNVPDRLLDQLTEFTWARVVDTNLTGVFSCIRAALPQLRASRGHVVVVSSVSGVWPDASGAAYQASKAGVLALARAAALEEHKRGVRFTSILPGMVETGLLEKRPGPIPPDVRAQCLRPEDVAAAILFALSLPERACVAELTLLPNALQTPGQT